MLITHGRDRVSTILPHVMCLYQRHVSAADPAQQSMPSSDCNASCRGTTRRTMLTALKAPPIIRADQGEKVNWHAVHPPKRSAQTLVDVAIMQGSVIGEHRLSPCLTGWHNCSHKVPRRPFRNTAPHVRCRARAQAQGASLYTVAP